MPTIVGLYETLQAAQGAVSDLVEGGFARGAVSLVMPSELSFDVSAKSPACSRGNASVALASSANGVVDCGSLGTRSVLVAGPLATALPRGGGDPAQASVLRALSATEVGATAAHYFTEAVCAGAILVAVRCEDMRVRDARDILDGHAPPDPRWLRPVRATKAAGTTANS